MTQQQSCLKCTTATQRSMQQLQIKWFGHTSSGSPDVIYVGTLVMNPWNMHQEVICIYHPPLNGYSSSFLERSHGTGGNQYGKIGLCNIQQVKNYTLPIGR